MLCYPRNQHIISTSVSSCLPKKTGADHVTLPTQIMGHFKEIFWTLANPMVTSDDEYPDKN